MKSELVEVIEAVEAVKRIPDTLKDHSFYGSSDVWHYIAILDDRLCDNCRQLSDGNYLGIDLRALFPDHLIIDDDQILPRVHLTLWGKDTCRCTMLRLTEPRDYITTTEPIPGAELP